MIELKRDASSNDWHKDQLWNLVISVMQVIDQEKTCHIFETSDHHDLDEFIIMKNIILNILKTISFQFRQRSCNFSMLINS